MYPGTIHYSTSERPPCLGEKGEFGVDGRMLRIDIGKAGFTCPRVRLVWHRTYQPSPDDPLDFEATIEASLLELKSRFKVRKVLFDPYHSSEASAAQRCRPIEGLAIG